MEDIQSIANSTASTKTNNPGRTVEVTINAMDTDMEKKRLEQIADAHGIKLQHTQFPTKRIAKGKDTDVIGFLLEWKKPDGYSLQTIAGYWPKLASATAYYQNEEFPRSKQDELAQQQGEGGQS